jgi:hypothetical protein
MQLFSRNKLAAVQGFLLKIVNNNCSEVAALIEGPRLEGRVNLSVVVRVVPVGEDGPRIESAFATVTKEFSTSGVALVLDHPRGLDEVLVGFHWERETKWIRAQAKHLNPIGGGFYQIGLRMIEMVPACDLPGLETLAL